MTRKLIFNHQQTLLLCDQTMATENPDDMWTEEKCIQLIREYKSRPMLWDPLHALYYKKQKKLLAWKEIGEALNCSPTSGRHKMMVLLSSLRREKAKLKQSRFQIANGLSTGPEYKSRWFAYEEMKFILDKDGERKRQAGSSTPNQEDDEDYNTDTESDAPPPKKIFQTDTTTQPFSQPRRPMTADSSKDYRPQTTADNDQEIESFTSFIASKMRKYSERTKNAVQQAICEIIFKADQSCYDGESSSRSGYRCVNIDDMLQEREFNMKNEQSEDDSN